MLHRSLEGFAATEFNEIFSGRQPRQDMKVFGRFGNYVPIFTSTPWRGGRSYLPKHRRTFTYWRGFLRPKKFNWMLQIISSPLRKEGIYLSPHPQSCFHPCNIKAGRCVW